MNSNEIIEDSNNFKGNNIIYLDGLPTKKDPESSPEDNFKLETETKKVKRFSTIMNLLNSVLGISILSVPNSMINSGVIGSLIILIFIAILSYYSTLMVISLQLETESEGFDDLAKKILGPLGSITLSILTLLFLVLGLISFLIIASDMIKSWLMFFGYDVSSFGKRTLIIIIYSFLIPFLLTIPRSISFLSFFSTITVICIFFYVFSIFYKFIINYSNNKIHNTVILFK